MEEKQALDRATKIILEKTQPKLVILFGSRSRGEWKGSFESCQFVGNEAQGGDEAPVKGSEILHEGGDGLVHQLEAPGSSSAWQRFRKTWRSSSICRGSAPVRGGDSHQDFSLSVSRPVAAEPKRITFAAPQRFSIMTARRRASERASSSRVPSAERRALEPVFPRAPLGDAANEVAVAFGEHFTTFRHVKSIGRYSPAFQSSMAAAKTGRAPLMVCSDTQKDRRKYPG